MITVVTAFYPLATAKHSVDRYLEWMTNFCRIPFSLVIATSPEMAPRIRTLRGNLPTVIIERPFGEWEMTSQPMMTMWTRHYEIDPEHDIHSPELYAIWAMKQEVVMEAIRLSPFGSDLYIWCDIGIQRYSHMQEWFMSFPNETRCRELHLPGQMTFLEVKPIPDNFINIWKNHLPVPLSLPSITLGGGCIMGDVAAWTEFSAGYKETLAQFDIQGRFAGKDQEVFFYMLIARVLSKPYRLVHGTSYWSPLSPVEAPQLLRRARARLFATSQQKNYTTGDHWMSMPVILGGYALAIIDERFNTA